MKALEKKLEYSLNALWMAFGMSLASLIHAWRQSLSPIKPLLALLFIGCLLLFWRRIAGIVRDKLR